MAVIGYCNGFVVTAAIGLLLLPVQYYIPGLYSSSKDLMARLVNPASTSYRFAWFDPAFLSFLPLDLVITIPLAFIVLFMYICEWIQIKLIERRIVQLNQDLGVRLKHLRNLNEQQEQEEATLKMVQDATSVYNLLLYLLLRQHRCRTAQNEQSPCCYLEKNINDDLIRLSVVNGRALLMAIIGYCNSFVVTAAVALLLLPVQYYVPDLYLSSKAPIATVENPASTSPRFALFDLAFLNLLPVDLFVTVFLVFVVFFTYICEWIQIKLIERRIVKLNQHLGVRLERLRALDEQQEQQEATLKMVQDATSEYNLLLYLLLRQHRYRTAQNEPPSNCYSDKNFNDDLIFLQYLKLDT